MELLREGFVLCRNNRNGYAGSSVERYQRYVCWRREPMLGFGFNDLFFTVGFLSDIHLFTLVFLHDLEPISN